MKQTGLKKADSPNNSLGASGITEYSMSYFYLQSTQKFPAQDRDFNLYARSVEETLCCMELLRKIRPLCRQPVLLTKMKLENICCDNHHNTYGEKTHLPCKCGHENLSSSLHHHHGHNSTNKHLCLCKRCRDKVGELFNYLQKSLLVHFTRRDFALLCGYVTCNAEQLHSLQHGPRYKHIFYGLASSGIKPCLPLELENENGLRMIKNYLPRTIITAKNYTQFHISSKEDALFYLSFIIANVMFTVVNCIVRKQLVKKYRCETERFRKDSIIFLSLVLIILTNEKSVTEKAFHIICSKVPKKGKTVSTVDSDYIGDNSRVFRKDVEMEMLDSIQANYKTKNLKGILNDIINYQQFTRKTDIITYPVNGNMDMSNELLRTGSLNTFPHDNAPSLIRLAQAGFYYEGKGREVVCFSCSAKNDVWSFRSVPLEIHRQISPDCAYLSEKFPIAQPSVTANCRENHASYGQITASTLNTHNIEADARHPCTDTASVAPASPAPFLIKSNNDSGCFGSSQESHNSNLTDASNRHQHSHMVTSVFKDSGYVSSGGNFQSNQSSSSYGSNQTRLQLPLVSERPMPNQHNVVIPASRDSPTPQNNRKNTPKEKYPEYIPIERRRATYKNWPPNLDFLHPLDLSECGFFYSNFGDCVRCFHCGIGLRNWESDDNPWVEHARWSRKCPYLLQKKGQEFIDSVLTVLGIQTDAEIEMQTANEGTEQASQVSSGYGTASSNDVRDPICHPAAQYIIRENIFGDNKEKQVKKTMNQLLQIHEWDDITNDILVNALLESKDVMENLDTKTNSLKLSESAVSKSLASSDSNTQTTKTEDKNKEKETQKSGEEDPDKIQKENEELKDLYTCKICLDERVGITFVPCGHLVTCKTCSPKIRRCPLCRTFIRGTIKTTM